MLAGQHLQLIARGQAGDGRLGDDAALQAVPVVCRTGTHLFLFAGYVERFRRWGPALRKAVGRCTSTGPWTTSPTRR